MAAIDIRSSALAGAEIGYWATAKRPGVMTNTVLQLAQVTREADYHQLYALVHPQNSRSAAVLLRAGFVNEGEMLRENRQYGKFVKDLLGEE